MTRRNYAGSKSLPKSPTVRVHAAKAFVLRLTATRGRTASPQVLHHIRLIESIVMYPQIWLAISYIPPVSVGTQIIVAVIVGLLTAFTVQFLLTNLGLALGISLLKYLPQVSSKATESSESQSDGIDVNISFFAGLGILLTLNTVLFIACFLAVRFSTARDPISGATLGIVICSIYFLILIWTSYSAVGSVTGWVFGSLGTKLRQLIKAIALAIPGTESETSDLLTEAAASDLIHQELKAALSEFDLQQSIDDYLKTIPSLQLDLTAVDRGFSDLLNKLNLESFADANLLNKIDRQTFIALIDERTNLPKSVVEQIVDRLYGVWQQAVAKDEKQDLNGELLQFLQSVNPEELQFEQLAKRLEQIVDKESKDNSADSDRRSPEVDRVVIDDNSSLIVKTWNTLDWRAIKNALLNRVDLSEVELEDVWHSLQSLYQKINSSESGSKQSFNIIRNDVEDFLWHASPWYLNCERGWQEFKEVIYDSQADPVQVHSQLEQVQPQDFVEILQQRDDLDVEKIDKIVEHLEASRQEVFSLIEQTELSERKQELSQLLKNYLQQAQRTELHEDNLPSRLEQLLIKSGVTTGVLTQFLDDWQQLDWHTWLEQRQDLEPTKLKQTTEQLTIIGDRLLEKVKDRQVKITSTAKELQHKLETYLRYTNLDHLTPAKIDAKLDQLWQSAQQQLPNIDRSELTKILEKRKGIDVDLVEAVITQIETKWQKSNDSITPEISQLQTKSTELSENLINYLYQAIEQNSTLAEIEADLLPQLNLDREQTKTLVNQQLAQLNWQEIEAKLKQAQKYSETKIQTTIKQAREATRKLIKTPRRWTTRTTGQAKNAVDELVDFFSHSNKIEFTSEHLEHELKSIFNRSKTQFDSGRDSIVAGSDRLLESTLASVSKSLSDRQDLTPFEIKQISDRFVAITQQLSKEIRTEQEQANELVRDLQDRLGEYLSSLNLFHLDYEQIKDSLANFDFQSLSDSWKETIAEIPLEELGDRLEQLSRQTLSTITDNNELFHDSTLQQIQGIQDYVAQQIETVKMTLDERSQNFKQQTLQQVEVARKAIAAAAYWIFAISFTSAIASALAGFLATIRLV